MALAQRTAGSGRRVVLVHGFTQTGRAWGAVGDALATDHEVVFVDAPGHGHSAAVEADLATGAQLLADVGGEATYLGYSMGGRLALCLALAHPEHVEALVLVGATGGIDDPAERATRRAADEVLAQSLEADGVDPFLEQWLAQPLFADLTPEMAQLEARRTNTVAGLASSLRLAGTGTMVPPLWDRLHEIEAPALVVAGEHDVKFQALGQRLSEAIGDNASLAIVPEAGHACHLERPEAFL
ncbi:MAG TPA: alpha/beta fold hydrolase, partial [Acidimicrobiales bacterium]